MAKTTIESAQEKERGKHAQRNQKNCQDRNQIIFSLIRWNHSHLERRAALSHRRLWRPSPPKDLSVSKDAKALFHASVRIEVGMGERTLFWDDPWLDGQSVGSIALAVLALVRPGVINSRTVQQGHNNAAWVRDIVGPLSIDAVVQFLRLWPVVQGLVLSDGEQDRFHWKFESSASFSTRSSYLACFAGRTALPAARQIWYSFAPLKYRFFSWLAVQDRCWTSDRLQRRGLPNQGFCPLCERVDECIDHLLLQCPFSRAIWFKVLRGQGLQRLMPSSTDEIREWWPLASSSLCLGAQRAFNSLCLLVLRSLWLERNARVFEGNACSAAYLTARILEDWQEWSTCRRGSVRGIL
ncbi:hypothetical protein ACQ4PT_039753 [Festuca glaucescens]